jgi:hypothetical protein
MILDQYGKQLESTSPFSDILGGWSELGAGEIGSATITTATALTQISRIEHRSAARLSFFTNPVISGALDLMHGFVIGEGVTYGEMNDKRAQDQMEEFYSVNKLNTRVSRWFYEYMVDGEHLTLFPKDDTQNPNRASRNEAARIGYYDVSKTLDFDVDKDMADQVTGIKTGGQTQRTPDEFVWLAHRAFWNDVRGLPVIMQAVPAAASYVDFIKDRIKLNKIQTRINGVYKTFIRSKTAEAALAEKQANAKAFASFPKSNTTVVIGMDPDTGKSEEYDLLSPSTNAADSSKDARLIFMLICTSLNLMEHYLGFTGETTRTTAVSQDKPVANALRKSQGLARSYLDDMMRLELKRRNGITQTYKVRKSKVLPGGDISYSTKRLPADMLYFPWQFPAIESESVTELISKLRFATEKELISDATLAAKLGIDHALEQEIIGSEEPDTPDESDNPDDPNGD